jgi:hypothetical protein
MRPTAVHRLEQLLQTRKLDATLATWAPPGAVASTGDPELDESLGGGWRCGAISEVIGPRSSGRSRVVIETLAAATAQGQVVALVDALDRFDPVTATAAGLDLRRVLWVRGPAVTVELARTSQIEPALRQALRAFDLIVRAGGFGLVVLDVADMPAGVLRMLPPATWLRLAHVIEGRPTAGLLAGEMPMGRSARGVTLRLDRQTRWTGTGAQARRFAGTRGAASADRRSFGEGGRVRGAVR